MRKVLLVLVSLFLCVVWVLFVNKMTTDDEKILRFALDFLGGFMIGQIMWPLILE